MGLIRAPAPMRFLHLTQCHCGALQVLGTWMTTSFMALILLCVAFQLVKKAMTPSTVKAYEQGRHPYPQRSTSGPLHHQMSGSMRADSGGGRQHWDGRAGHGHGVNGSAKLPGWANIAHHGSLSIPVKVCCDRVCTCDHECACVWKLHLRPLQPTSARSPSLSRSVW